MPQLEQGALVILDGLHSDNAKPLNGGYAIVLDSGSETAEGVWRYPVRIFATQKGDDEEGEHEYNILETVQNKKLKAANLTACPNAATNRVFQEAVVYHVKACQDKNDMKNLMFWLWAAHHVMPQIYHYGISYANALRDLEQNPTAAAAVMRHVFDTQRDQLVQDPLYPRFCREAVFSFCAAREHLDRALEYAMEIPLEEGEHAALATESLSELADTCRTILQEQKGIQGEEIASLNLQALRFLHEMNPGRSLYTENLAGAYCLAGNPWEGVKWYRRALAQEAEMENIRFNLVLAQLQCPGMPLEDYHSLGREGDEILCVHKKDLDKLRIDKETGSIISTHPDGLELIKYAAPSDSDDPELFASLLDALAKDDT